MTQKTLLKFFAGSRDVKAPPVAKEGRGGLVAVRFGEQPRMRLFVRTADSTTAEHVREYFTARGRGIGISNFSGGGGTFAMFDAPSDPVTNLAATSAICRRREEVIGRDSSKSAVQRRRQVTGHWPRRA